MVETAMSIPLVDLSAKHQQLSAEVEEGWQRVLDGAAFVLGSDVDEFEREFAKFTGVEHCIGVANGTDALELVLRALDVGPGDEVILPANTFIASALAIRRAGATPVLVDAVAGVHIIDVTQVADRIGPRTRAVMPVHLFGQMAPLEQLEDLTRDVAIHIVEDAAQSQGAARHGRPAGSVGDGAGTSFYPGKNLGAYGDAGAVLTQRDDIAQRVRSLRNYGSEIKYHHPEAGFNSRLDTLQAVVLRAKLKRLSAWNEGRRAAALVYDALLEDVPQLRKPITLEGNEHVWHLYVVEVPRREEVLACLQANGIGAGVHNPVPIHLQGAFSDLGHHSGNFPVAEASAARMLSLPMFPEITPAQQEYVVKQLRSVLG
jgi:dTDP-4-amino-4,6-dideoxygalactose transaminase